MNEPPPLRRALLDPARKLYADAEALLAAAEHLPRPWVFTNGVFDLLHRGHAAYLAQAKALGASLIVGVNSDASARGLGKGPGRPLVAEHDRCYLLAALESTDAVLTFAEPTPLALIAALRPDVYVKGGDYDIDKLAEAALVRSWGGRAQALPFAEGYSSSALVRRIDDAQRRSSQ
jgi:rfaE bifunctional protein nucleotidyltransferase chain/domain